MPHTITATANITTGTAVTAPDPAWAPWSAAGAAGLAVGVVGGMVAAEVIDEVGDFFEGDDEEGEEG